MAYQTIPINILANSGINTTFIAKFILFIAVMLFTTLLVGKILKILFNLPIVAGQIIGGLILGPSLLNITKIKYFSQPLEFINTSTQQIYAIASSDIFFFFVLLLSTGITVSYLLWLAGHETDVQDMIKVGMESVIGGFLGAVAPIAMSLLIFYYIFNGNYTLASSVALGICFSATSVSIPIAMLISQKKMHLRSSKSTMGAAIVDDILAVFLFSMFIIFLQTGILGNQYCTQNLGECRSISGSLVRMLLSFIIMFLIGYFFIRPISYWLKKIQLTHLIPSFAMLAMFGYFCMAELIGGLAGITGAYFAGLFHRMGDTHHSAERAISPYVNTFLLPLFLGSIGMQVDLNLLGIKELFIVIILLIIAITSKLAACFLTTFISNKIKNKHSKKWSLLESYIFGSAMVARGEVDLIIATILSSTNIITQQQYVACIAVILLTTIASPIMLAFGFAKMEKHEKEKRIQKEEEAFAVNIGPFKYFSSRLVFDILVAILEKEESIKSIVQVSEGNKVLTISESTKIFLRPDEGIVIAGDKNKVKEIIHKLDMAINKDIQNIHEKTITQI